MEVKEDDDKNRLLSITVELAPVLKGNGEMVDAIAFSIYTQLVRLNSEFANYVPPQYQLPQVTLLSFGDPEYFPIGVKHRYTRLKD
jgi:phenylacetate-CoA ligase